MGKFKKEPTIIVGNVNCKLIGVTQVEAGVVAKAMKVRQPNYFFNSAYKKGLWDGYVKFFVRPSNTFPTGLLPTVLSVLKDELEIVPIIKDERTNVEGFQVHPISENYHVSDEKTARDYQVEAYNALASNKVAGLTFQRGILNLATNAGKTTIAIALIKELYPKLVSRNRIFLFITHSKEIANQTKAAIERDLGIEVGYLGGGQWDVKPVCVAIVATMFRNISVDKFNDISERTVALVADECLQGDSKILLPDNTTMSIKEVCENESITEVMSYNLENNIFEPKKILRKMVTPANGSFMAIYYNDPITGQEQKLFATGNHKIWTQNKGYTRMDELEIGDIIKVNTSNPDLIKSGIIHRSNCHECMICGATFKTALAANAHIQIHDPWYKERCKEAGKHRVGKPRNFSEEQRAKSSAFMKEYNSRPEVKKRSSEWCKSLLNTPEITAKRVESWKKKFQADSEWRETQLERFKNAPIYNKQKMTNLESWVVSLGIPQIEFTGNGAFWLTFSEDYHKKYGKRYKNPDFVVHNGSDKKVIEVGDIEYWHNQKEIDDVIREYQKLGYECLYLTSEQIAKQPDWCRGKIEKFIFNHNVPITRIVKTLAGQKPKYKYNLEVEDNHNYFANNILVSNCHHAAAKTFLGTLNAFTNASIRVGLTGTVDKKNIINEWNLYGATGEVLMKVSNDYLVTHGYSAKPVCIFLKITEPDVEGLGYHTEYQLGIEENDVRNQVITRVSMKEVQAGHKVLILVEHMVQGQLILQDIENVNPDVKAYFTNGQLNNELRQGLLDAMKANMIDVLIATSILDEGVDVSNINAVIYARGMKSSRKLLQGIGRGLRKKSDGSVLRFYDFIDDVSVHMLKHSKERATTLKNEGFKMKILDIDTYEGLTWEEINETDKHKQ